MKKWGIERMMKLVNIFTIGFTKKSAKDFFSVLKKNNINLLIDVRLNNKSQLAGFTKGDDFSFFLETICNIKYVNNSDFAPTQELLKAYRKNEICWKEYEKQYNELITKRKVELLLEQILLKYNKPDNICLLCSEPLPNECHRRLLAEYLAKKCSNINSIIHI